MILVPPMVDISKNENRTLITKTHELFNRILFDFRIRLFSLPVFEKHTGSGLRSETEVKNVTLHRFRVCSIHPESFIRIGRVGSEE